MYLSDPPVHVLWLSLVLEGQVGADLDWVTCDCVPFRDEPEKAITVLFTVFLPLRGRKQITDILR